MNYKMCIERLGKAEWWWRQIRLVTPHSEGVSMQIYKYFACNETKETFDETGSRADSILIFFIQQHIS